MPHLHQLAQDAGHLLSRKTVEAARAVPEVMENIVEQMADFPTKVKREPSSSTSSSSSSSTSCTGSSTECEKYYSSNSIGMIIALATVIPICMAAVVFFFLHRRHVRRLREEEANDKHKSLDFGLDEVAAQGKPKKGKKGAKGEKAPEMSLQETQQQIRRDRGMSLDMTGSNPYLLPPGLEGSRESLHSMSRSLVSDDRYRPATIFQPNDPMSPSYPPSLRGDDSSSITGGSSRRPFHQNESSQNLLRNASQNPRSMSRPVPPTNRYSVDSVNSPVGSNPYPPPPVPRKATSTQREGLSPANRDAPRASYVSDNASFDPGQAPSRNDPTAPLTVGEVAPLAPLIDTSSKPTSPASPPPVLEASIGHISPPRGLPSNPRSGLENRQSPNPPNMPEVFAEQPAQPTPDSNEHVGFDFDTNFHVDPPQDMYEPATHDEPEQLYEQDLGYDPNRLTMGLRPLPPEDPNDNPEQRANRIRSFYKEYFDDGGNNNNNRASHFPANDYYGEYDAEFSAYDTPIFDPDSGTFITPKPFADPITRRAMTPPPRGPPRFRAGPRGHIPSAGSENFGRGPRAFSSTSGRLPLPGKPKKKAPPPAPLATLPTPAMLKDDSFMATEFAPPQSYNERMGGASPDSPKGGFRPFSPSLRPHKALVSSFDDLAVLPSPHALRKSGTFTSLDFAPPPRFKNSDAGSDAGSIRSNRSGMSAVQRNAVRNGAFRLSRVPKDQVGTRDDIAEALKPSWDMRK